MENQDFQPFPWGRLGYFTEMSPGSSVRWGFSKGSVPPVLEARTSARHVTAVIAMRPQRRFQIAPQRGNQQYTFGLRRDRACNVVVAALFGRGMQAHMTAQFQCADAL